MALPVSLKGIDLLAVRSDNADSGPVRGSERITSLDLIRGVAVLGILLMNAVHFRFGSETYFDLSAGGSESWLDWTVGILGEVFIDQKFMGLFSLLFGAGMILFIDRASRKGRRAVMLNPVAKRAAASYRHPRTSSYGAATCLWCMPSRRCIPDRPAEAAEPPAHLHWGRGVRAVGRVFELLAQYIARPATSASPSPVSWTPGEISDEEVVGLLCPAGLFSARRWGLIFVGRGLVSHGFHERRLAREDVSTGLQ